MPQNQTAEAIKQKRRDEKASRMSAAISEDPKNPPNLSDPSEVPQKVSESSNDVAEFARQLIEAVSGSDREKTSKLFKQSVKQWTDKEGENLETTMKRAISKGNEGGHVYTRWVRTPPPKYVGINSPPHQHNYHTICRGCGHALIVRMQPPRRGPNGRVLGEFLRPEFGGRTMAKTCLVLSGKKYREEKQTESFSAIHNA